VLYGALSERERDTAKAGAAILDYRVKDLLRLHRVDASAYHLTEPLSSAGEWDRVHRLLDTAEIRALSRRDLGDLCAERRDILGLVGGNPSPTAEPTAAHLSSAQAGLDQTAAARDEIRQTLAVEVDRRRPDRARAADLKRQLSGLERRHAEESLRLDMLRQRRSAAADSVDQRAGLRERHDLLSVAIDLIVDDAVATAVAHPARYLTALLGPRPTGPGAAADWDRRVRNIEAWRHHHLGLGYGQAAAGPHAPPSEQALGPISDDPIEALGRRRILDHCQTTLDLGVSR
jgi:hypothetical protein